MERTRWILAAALSALACHLAVQHVTPIDRALPFLAVLVTILGAVSYSSIMLAVPLLILAEIAIPHETMRLLAFGIMMSLCVVPAVLGRQGRPRTAAAPTLLTLIAILLLRWIPLENVLLWRELFLIAIAVAIVFVLGRTPFAITIAVITTLITPAVPLRTLALPLLVLAVAIAARIFGMPDVKLTWPSAVVLAFVILFFPWSGVVARAFPYFLKEAGKPTERVIVAQALPPRASATFDVPEGKTRLIVSGANVAQLRRGAPLGTIEPGGIPLRIGDAADWGYMRRAYFFGTHNPLPNDPAGTIRGYGYEAWVDGAGRVALPRGVRQIRVIADASLPADASLQVEGFE